MPAKIPVEQFLNKTFGRLTIVEDLGLCKIIRKRKVIAVCNCGMYKEYCLRSITKGDSKSCGCIKIDQFYDVIGNTYGLLKVVEELMRINNKRMLLVQCSCGNRTMTSLTSLKAGTQSCGCIQRKRAGDFFRTHGLSKHYLYGTWGNIKSRCCNPNVEEYENYGGRGIAICEEWLNDFMSFYNWCIENGWEKGLSIDRVNNDGHYEPDNCRIVALDIQSRNKRNNIWIEYNGEKMVVIDWAKKLGIKEGTIYNRIINGMSPQEALTKPIRPNNFQSKKISNQA